jgi:hypothetical protein
MTDLRSIVTGAIVGASVVILTLYMIKPDLQPVANPDNTNSNFTVVDTYKGCDVVRWGNGFADYKYFLHCEK